MLIVSTVNCVSNTFPVVVRYETSEDVADADYRYIRTLCMKLTMSILPLAIRVKMGSIRSFQSFRMISNVFCLFGVQGNMDMDNSLLMLLKSNFNLKDFFKNLTADHIIRHRPIKSKIRVGLVAMPIGTKTKINLAIQYAGRCITTTALKQRKNNSSTEK